MTTSEVIYNPTVNPYLREVSAVYDDFGSGGGSPLEFVRMEEAILAKADQVAAEKAEADAFAQAEAANAAQNATFKHIVEYSGIIAASRELVTA